ncbi:MAG: AbrB/MazE/SpoVT family DNA-binding domain-containing protein [Clostridia bacterium]|nr:AbrB/MazE/SpoVT family DNA-binding domain-containing protein [Clostridia bacterium]
MDEKNKKNIKTVDEFGRILIPKSIRKQFGINSGDNLVYEVDADRIILRRPTEKCIFCQSEEGVETTMGRPVCKKCMEKLKNQ